MPLRRETPFAFTPEQKAFLETVIKTPSGRVRRTRQKGAERDALTAKQRDAFLANALEQLTWLTTEEGKEHLDSRDDDTISASASILTNLLHFVTAAGHSPLQVLQAAVLGYSTQVAHDDEFRLVYEFPEEVQDVADNTIGCDHEA
jgi:hypothetical protein